MLSTEALLTDSSIEAFIVVSISSFIVFRSEVLDGFDDILFRGELWYWEIAYN
jgi:hypothetical protein